MGSAEPIPGRCGARLRGERAGQFCSRYPMKGKTRCKNHGGASTGRPIKHGRYSQRFRKGSEAFAEEVETALADPDLLDTKRPLAALTALMHSCTVIPDGEDVDEEERHRQVEGNRKLMESVHKAQMAVLRETGVREALTQAVPALIGQLFLTMRSTVERMVPDERLRERLLEELANDARRVLVETHELAVEHRKR